MEMYSALQFSEMSHLYYKPDVEIQSSLSTHMLAWGPAHPDILQVKGHAN